MREAEAEEKRVEREAAAEERRLPAEREAVAEEKRAEREAEERKAAMELERLKLELEAKRLETAARPAGIAKEVVRRSARIARSPELPAFVDGRNDLDNYQRWSPRGRPWPRGRPRGQILKSLALASRPQVLENWPVLGSRSALFFGKLKFCGAVEKFFGKRFFVEIA